MPDTSTYNEMVLSSDGHRVLSPGGTWIEDPWVGIPDDRRTAEATLTGRCKDSRKIGNNTYLERHMNDIVVKLHDTHVVVYRADGDIVLDSGGWQTHTTKDRMNRHTRAMITQAAGEWYVTWHDWAGDFSDGMVLHTDGRVTP